MIVAERGWAERNGLRPMRAPRQPMASAPSSRACSASGRCRRCGRPWSGPAGRWSDVERVEINEAFAAIALAVTRELGFAEDIVNVEGGAIAHGHPIGATGAVLTTRLLHSMQRDGLKRGIVTLCIGGGQGIALCHRDALLTLNRHKA